MLRSQVQQEYINFLVMRKEYHSLRETLGYLEHNMKGAFDVDNLYLQVWSLVVSMNSLTTPS